MKINLISDLHLEFDDLELPGGEVLIIAGDACESRTLTRHKYDAVNLLGLTPSGKRMDRAARFFNEECTKYERVLYVMGNHEHYHGTFQKTAEELRDKIPSNIQLLECETAVIGDVVFAGCTMWTDCNRYNNITMYTLENSMNDYRSITWNHEQTYRKLRASDTAMVHRHSLEWLKKIVAEHQDRKVVVITHHAPSFLSVATQYRDDQHMNGGYYSDLSDVILDNPQIKFWVHGHTHHTFDYEIGSCRVMCNPRGYVGYEQRAVEFDPTVGFEL